MGRLPEPLRGRGLPPLPMRYILLDRQDVSFCRSTEEPPSMGTILYDPACSEHRTHLPSACRARAYIHLPGTSWSARRSQRSGAGFRLIPEAVSGLVELETGIDAIYEPEPPFEQFRLEVSDDGELVSCQSRAADESRDSASVLFRIRRGLILPLKFRGPRWKNAWGFTVTRTRLLDALRKLGCESLEFRRSKCDFWKAPSGISSR